MKAYIAHPFNTRYKIKDWINKLEKKDLPIKFINPFFPKRDTEKFDKNSMSTDKYYRKLNCNTIVEGDIKLIASCDCAICIITGDLSYGTIQEMVYANFLKKKVYTICTNGHHNHPWILYHSNRIFKSFKEFEKWLIT